MRMDWGSASDRQWVRASAVILGFTAVLTADFVGILALIERSNLDVASRVPVYSLAMAGAFVATIYSFSRYGADARTVLLSATGFGVAAFVLVGLAVEGVVYALTSPGRAFDSQVVIYFLAAGLMGTGVGYWLVAYWRDLVEESGPPARADHPD